RALRALALVVLDAGLAAQELVDAPLELFEAQGGVQVGPDALGGARAARAFQSLTQRVAERMRPLVRHGAVAAPLGDVDDLGAGLVVRGRLAAALLADRQAQRSAQRNRLGRDAH